MVVTPIAERSAARGSRTGSAYGTAMRATRCAARYSATKMPAYVSEPASTSDDRAM
jgi:hypothetical protein